MPRLDYLQDQELGAEALEYIRNAELTGAPGSQGTALDLQKPDGVGVVPLLAVALR